MENGFNSDARVNGKSQNTDTGNCDTSSETGTPVYVVFKETAENETQQPEEPVVVIEEAGDSAEKAPDGGWGWWIVLGSLIMHMLMGGFERSTGIMYQQFLGRFNNSAAATAWVTSIFSTLRLILGGFQRCTGIMYQHFLARFNGSATATAWVAAFFSGSYLFLGPVASALCTRFSCRSVVIFGGVLAMISLILSGYAMNLEFLYFSYGVLGGFGRALSYTPSLVIVGYYFNKRRGLAVGLATSGVGFGTFFLPPLMEVLFDFYGFAGAFLVLSGITAHFCISGAFFRPLELHHRIVRNERKIKSKQEHTANDIGANKHLLNGFTADQSTKTPVKLLEDQSASKLASSMDITAAVKIESRSRRPSLFQKQWNKVRKSIQGPPEEKKRPFIEFALLKNFSFLALCLAILMFTIAFNSTFVFLPPLAAARGMTKIQAAYLVSLLGLLDGLSRLIMSIILDLKKVKPYRLYIYNGVVFLTGAVSLSFPAMTTFVDFVLLSCLYGILSGTYISQKSVVIVDILGVEKLASSFGLLLMFQGIGSFIGPPVGGLIKDYVGTYDGAFFVGSAGTFLGGFILLIGNIWQYRQNRKARKQEE